MTPSAPRLEILLPAQLIASKVADLADRIAPTLDPSTIVVCLLSGGLWFAADLTRALADRGLPLDFDAIWLASYGDGKLSGGRCELRAGLQRPVAGRHALVVDDVFDTGLSLSEATRLVGEAGAERVTTAVFARKPWPQARSTAPDHVAWEAPDRYLVGYGMDLGGAYRGLPYIAAVIDDESQGAAGSRAIIAS
jgi:hypoxanthine phosphoribosyltransferase